MSRPPPRDTEEDDKTVLDKVRPTVVVRRRVYEPTASNAPRTLVHVARGTTDEEDDAGPPSSVNVARALASLRGDELKRLEEIVSADDDPASIAAPRSLRGSSSAMRAAAPVIEVIEATPSRPTLKLGVSTALGDLALALGVAKQDLMMSLVTRGFFSLTVKSMLPRETARLAADMYGFATEDDDTIVDGAATGGGGGGGAKKKKKPLQDEPKAAPRPPTAKKPSAPKRTVNRGR